MTRSLSRVFSSSNEDSAVHSMDDAIAGMDLRMPDEHGSEENVLFCDDLALSPLPHMARELSLQRAGVTAQKWALKRSMSNELPGDSPAELAATLPPPVRSPAGAVIADACQTETICLPLEGMLRNSCQLTYCIDQLEGCSIDAVDMPNKAMSQTPQPIHPHTNQWNGSDGEMDAGSDEDDGEKTGPTVWERVFHTVKPAAVKVTQMVHRHSLPSSGASGGAVGAGAPPVRRVDKKHKKRRVVKKDPNRPKPKPWSEAELQHFRRLLQTEGPNNWAKKAITLGTNRTAKSLHTRWLRDEGRIVDKPRGIAAMREQALQAARASQEH